MTRPSIKFGLLAGSFTVVMLASGASAVLATDSPSPSPVKTTDTPRPPQPPQPTASPSTAAGTNNPQMHKEGRLDGDRLKICQSHQDAINRYMRSPGDFATKQINVINQIFDRVQAFSKEKGKTVANYDTLVANANAKKAAAQAAIDKVKADGGSFKCDGDNPLGQGEVFKGDIPRAVAALKDYKESVRTLIKAVQTALGVTGSTEHKATATGGSQ